VLLCFSAQPHDASGHSAIDAMFLDKKTLANTTVGRRITAFRRSNQPLSSTQKVKPFWMFIAQLRNTTTHSSADNKRYDWMGLHDKLSEKCVILPIKHREFRPIDYAYNARISGPRYRQRAMFETAFSTIKCTLADTVRVQTWYGEFREVTPKYISHNIKQLLKQ